MCRVVVGCALVCGRPHRAFRHKNQLTALPESFGQLTALEKLDLSRRNACAKVWGGPCAVAVWVSATGWVSRQGGESAGLVCGLSRMVLACVRARASG